MTLRAWIMAAAALGCLQAYALPTYAKDERAKPAVEPAKPAAPGPKAAAPSPADKETARNLMDRGDVQFEAADYAGALESYTAADKIMSVTSTGFAVGKTLAKLNQLVEARDKLLAVTRIPAPPNESGILSKAREAARVLQDEVAARIPTVTFEIAGPTDVSKVVLTLDKAELSAAALTLPRRVNPGDHEVVVNSAGGWQELRTTFSVAANEEKRIPLVLLKDTGGTGKSGGISPLVFVGFGTAGAGLLLGAITGGVSLSMAASVEEGCVNETQCKLADESKADTATALAHVSTAGFVLAGVGAGVGIVGLFLGGDEAESEPVAGLTIKPLVGPTSIGISGTF